MQKHPMVQRLCQIIKVAVILNVIGLGHNYKNSAVLLVWNTLVFLVSSSGHFNCALFKMGVVPWNTVRIRVVGIIECGTGALAWNTGYTLWPEHCFTGERPKARPRAIEKECKVSVSPSLLFIFILMWSYFIVTCSYGNIDHEDDGGSKMTKERQLPPHVAAIVWSGPLVDPPQHLVAPPAAAALWIQEI